MNSVLKDVGGFTVDTDNDNEEMGTRSCTDSPMKVAN